LFSVTNFWSLGGFDDDLYYLTFKALQCQDIGLLQEIDCRLREGLFDRAAELNNNLNPTIPWVDRYRQVFEVYLRTWAQGNFSLTELDSNQLWPVALITPYEGGPGVYSARVMLGIEPEDYFIPYSSPITADSSNRPSFSIFPNPAQNNVTIISAYIQDDDTKFEIYGVIGNLILSLQIEKQSDLNSIYVGNLSNGMYLCRILSKSEVSDIQKLVISK